ncbi:TniQ family protein [Paraburkholderia youngii]|uniref:TniQ family protein n=1 Tax=Paraburkholderia youngii TaxID=2782701 RepID=UPI003D1D6904
MSFFRRTSNAHAVLPRSLAYRLIVPLLDIPSQLSADLMADECYRLELCGLSAKTERWIEVLNQLTSRSDLQLLTLLPLRNLVSSYQLIEYVNRFCPACYAEDEQAGRQKYDRLLWTIRCVTACPKHGSRLVFEPRVKWHSPLPFTVPGTSRIDGSSLSLLTSKRAFKHEVVVARLVSELFEDISRISEQKASLVPVFLAHAADSLFAGNFAALARHLGLSKSQVHGWMHEGILPSLPGVTRIAYAFECTMADVLLGNMPRLRLRQGCKFPHGLFGLPRKAGYKSHHRKLLTLLSTFMNRNPDACAQDAAHHLDVSPKFLRENFPAQNESLVNAGRLHRQEIAQARRDAKDDAYKKLHLALADSGTYPSRRKVTKQLKAIGIHLTFADERRAKKKADTASRIGTHGHGSVSDDKNSA